MKQIDDTVLNGVQIPPYVEFIICHNQHNGMYAKLEDYLDTERFSDGTKEQKLKCIEEDSLWEVQFYPITPIGFEFYFSHSLAILLETIEKLKDEDDD